MKIGRTEVYGIIYKITNHVNDKVYIGQSVNGFNKRYKAKGKGIERVYKYYIKERERGKYYNDHLFKSMVKYGLESFSVREVLDIAFSQTELDIKEDVYIQLFNSSSYKYGYNKKDGGANGKASEYLRTKNSISHLGYDISQYKKDIINMYLREFITPTQIGEKYSVSSVCIMNALNRWGIKIRGNSEALIGFDIFNNTKEIIDMYVNKNMSLESICKNIMSQSHVSRMSY